MGVLNGAVMPYLLNLSIQYYRDNVFTPGRVLQAMDLGGGILNLSGIELLCKIEIMQKLPASKCILPTAADIKQLASRMQMKAAQQIPYQLKYNGSTIDFD